MVKKFSCKTRATNILFTKYLKNKQIKYTSRVWRIHYNTDT